MSIVAFAVQHALVEGPRLDDRSPAGKPQVAAPGGGHRDWLQPGPGLVSGRILAACPASSTGLFGFIWMRGKLDPASGLRLNQADIVMMVGWFFLCLIGIIPHVANGAHGFGLVMGMIWGAAPPLAKKLLKR
jgi:hypothetical protein